MDADPVDVHLDFSSKESEVTVEAPSGVTPRRRQNSLLFKTTAAFLCGVVLAYLIGALIGWWVFTTSAREEWVLRAETNTQISASVLRSVYTFVAVETSGSQITRIVTPVPIGDDASVLESGFHPSDVLTIVATQTRNDAWLFRYDAANNAFTPLAATTHGIHGMAPGGQLKFEDLALDAASAAFVSIEGERHFVGTLPIVDTGGETIGLVLASVGPESVLVAPHYSFVRNSALILLVILALTTLASRHIALRLFGPVPDLIRSTRRIADDRTDTSVPHQNRSDELGSLAVAIETLRRNMVERGQLRDIRDMALELAHLAHHDPLTGLANRAKLMTVMEEAIGNLQPGQALNVLMLDLDRFKSINDTKGHACGDRVLVEVAQRLTATIGPLDLVARLGGDEFAIVQGVGKDAAEEGERLAARLIDALSRPLRLEGEDIPIGTSIGVATAPLHGEQASVLLNHADLALYRSKADGRGSFNVFEPGMDMTVHDRHAQKLSLERAIEREEFVLHYQPIIEAATTALYGYEALVRWNHPDRGLVGPDDFIGLAEETGLIVLLGEWIIRRALHDALSWAPGIKVCVNLSAAQLHNPRLAGVAASALADSGLPAERVEFEVTETVSLNGAQSLAALEALQALGVSIAIDGFGTGYASCSNLLSHPFSKLKIDRSFVSGLNQDETSRAIAASLVGLGRNLRLEVTAEGIETAEQAELMRLSGCTYLQGYYFSRPVPLSQTVAPSTQPGRALDAYPA